MPQRVLDCVLLITTTLLYVLMGVYFGGRLAMSLVAMTINNNNNKYLPWKYFIMGHHLHRINPPKKSTRAH